MSRQSFHAVDGPDAPPASHTAVASTTTRTNLWSPSLWTPINAADPKAGKAYMLRAGGVMGTTGTPTIIFNPTWGQSGTPGSNVALGASITLTLPGLTAVPWYAEFTLCFRQLGMTASASTATGSGFVAIGGPAATASQVVAIGGSVPTNLDHTTAQGMCLDVTWSASSASNTITAQWTVLASLN